MTAPHSPPASAAPRVNPLQRLWLRELGMERLWLRPAPQPQAAPAATPQVAVSKQESPAAPPQVAVSKQESPAPAMPARVGAVPARDAAAPPAASAVRPAGPGPGLRNGPPPKPAPKAEVVTDAAPAVIPVAEAVKNATLDELREQVVACTACGLCGGRRHAVFGHGGQPTRWLVVGEAPGEQEDRQGQPFVGRSGQLLDSMLSAVGMSRERDVFIANVIKCRPPGNRNPKPEEIAACSPYLMRQIALLKPERILVLGRFAAQTLLGTDATIGSLRGRVHQMKTEEGREIPVIVSYHPAYLLRSPAEKARAWQDLKLASRQL
ncbi:uracil-DNA glycosylase [Achromobacter ruhlandii]|uniref:uracil-DNA glycosylase n=1 Tax=Achromobacter ruhlandii TaxID=72557 RepID=UPI003B9B80E4